MRCVARSTTLLEPHVVDIHITQFRPQEVTYHRTAALADDGYGNASMVLEEVRTDDFIRPQYAPNSDFIGMHLVLVYLVWIGIVPNLTILLIYISIHPRMSVIAKDIFFSETFLERSTDFENKI